MIFVRAGNYFLESKCQHYTVAKVSLDAERWEYVAWFKSKEGALMLGSSEDPQKAQGLCTAHHGKKPFAVRTEESIAKFIEAQRG